MKTSTKRRRSLTDRAFQAAENNCIAREHMTAFAFGYQKGYKAAQRDTREKNRETKT